MRTLKAPEGYEAGVVYEDGSRSWAVYARKLAGSIWWTKCGIVGHPQMTQVEVDALASTLLRTWIRHGLVK
jgi:hypothetical protein